MRGIQEERAWWDTYHGEINAFIERAASAEVVKRGPVIRKPEPTVQTTIRLLEHEYRCVKEKASQKGLRYQSYMRMLIHESLEHSDTEDKLR